MSVGQAPTGRDPIGRARAKTLATDKPEPPEGFRTYESPGNDDDDESTVELEPGEVLNGRLLDVTEGENENGPWFLLKIKDESRGVVNYFAKDDAKRAARVGDLELGEPVWIAKDTEARTFQDDDGKEQEYYPTNIALPDGGA